jgi:hypothetical protein
MYASKAEGWKFVGELGKDFQAQGCVWLKALVSFSAQGSRPLASGAGGHAGVGKDLQTLRIKLDPLGGKDTSLNSRCGLNRFFGHRIDLGNGRPRESSFQFKSYGRKFTDVCKGKHPCFLS